MLTAHSFYIYVYIYLFNIIFSSSEEVHLLHFPEYIRHCCANFLGLRQHPVELRDNLMSCSCRQIFERDRLNKCVIEKWQGMRAGGGGASEYVREAH